MSSSCRAGSVNSTASGTVTPGISPTVSTCASRPANTSRYISCRNSWLRGPQMKYWKAGSVPGSGAGRGVRQGRVLADHVDDVHAEAVHAAVQPPAHHGVDGLADLGVLPVQVRLLGGEDVQVVLPGRLIKGPGWAGEEGFPVGGLVPPPVPVALGVVPARAGLDEPGVLVGGVVDHQVHDQLHAAGVQLRRAARPGRRGCRTAGRCPVVADVVAVVVHRRAVDRGQPDHVHAETVQVVDVADDAAQVADAVAVGVGEAAGIDLVDDPAPPVLGTTTGQGGRWLRRLP